MSVGREPRHESAVREREEARSIGPGLSHACCCPRFARQRAKDILRLKSHFFIGKNGPSNSAATVLSTSGMGTLCGHLGRHVPHSVHSDATDGFPPKAPELKNM